MRRGLLCKETHVDTIRFAPPLSITKDDGVTTVVAGDGVTYTYTITVTNSGSQIATGVVVTDTLDPALVALVSGATGSVNGTACTVDDNDGTDGCQFDGTDTVTFAASAAGIVVGSIEPLANNVGGVIGTALTPGLRA